MSNKTTIYHNPKCSKSRATLQLLRENNIDPENIKTSVSDLENEFNPYQGFGDIIRDEDYVVAAASHKGLRSGAIDYITFGKNEPALHHYHNTFREALDLEPLPIIKI